MTAKTRKQPKKLDIVLGELESQTQGQKSAKRTCIRVYCIAN